MATTGTRKKAMGIVLDWMLMEYNGNVAQVVPIMEAFSATHCIEKIEYLPRQEILLDTCQSDVIVMYRKQKDLDAKIDMMHDEIAFRRHLE